MRVLLVEDDAPVAAGIEAGLALSDFVVDIVTTLDGARGRWPRSTTMPWCWIAVCPTAMV